MHTTLVPYWSRILSKDRIISRQLSARGGTLYCELCGDRVKLSGKCQLYLSGEIDLCEKIYKGEVRYVPTNETFQTADQ
jgi:hypothetical protein